MLSRRSLFAFWPDGAVLLLILGAFIGLFYFLPLGLACVGGIICLSLRGLLV